MTPRRVLVTGAGSYVGQALLADLAGRADLTVTAFGSPRWDGDAPAGTMTWSGDLTGPLPSDAQDAIDQADSILHLAWVRGAKTREVHAANDAILNHLAARGGLERVTFTSTVAAGPRSPSIYGQAKQRAADRIHQEGGRVLVLGGVVSEPPGSSHAELCQTVATSRTALRFAPPVPKLHLTTLEAVVAALSAAALNELPPGVHAVFDPVPVAINAFMRTLEARVPRVRVPVPVWSPAVVGAARTLKGTPAGPIFDRLVSFIGRDEAWLASLTPLP